MTSTARKSSDDLTYEQAQSTKELLEEVWEAIDGKECEACEGTGEIAAQDGDMCEACDGTGEITTYEGQDAREYLEEMPLEIVYETGEPFAVVLGTGGPHVEITGGGSAQPQYKLCVYWAGSQSYESGEAITRTGEYFREICEENDV